MALLEMTGVSKAFPGVLALDRVTFSIDRGEIRALMGENGAGKSTLIKVLTGVHQCDSGTMTLDGTAMVPQSPVHAQGFGISTVYQEVNLVPNLSVAENVCLGYEPRVLGKIKWRQVNERAKRAMSRLNIDIDVSRPLEDFSAAVQQLVGIARAVDRDAKVIILDEPTSSLDKDEGEQLFALMRKLRTDGLAIVFVTHFIEQVYSIADSVTVLRNGAKVGDWQTAELPRRLLVAQMLGREIEDVPRVDHSTGQKREVRARVEGLGRRKTMEPVSFTVGVGETVGLSGLLGSGRTETMKIIFGAVPGDSGSLQMVGTGARDSSLRARSPRDAIRRGIGFCPEDRKAEGVCNGLSVAENILLVIHAKRGWLTPIPRSQAASLVTDYVEKLQIKASDVRAPIESLSGGNQQKVLLSRWLAAEPELLLLDEPTRGIDVGSKLEIRRLVTELAKRGMSFVFSSAELEEVVSTCDRVVILRDRRMVGEVSGPEVTEQNLMAQIAGSEK